MSVTLLGQTVPYKAPEWMPCFENTSATSSSSSSSSSSSKCGLLTPAERVVMAHTPTPIQRVALPGLPASCPAVFVKRDDMTGGIELGGNKIRKLEFILAKVKAEGFDCVVTAGGTQSNHCRATTAAARSCGLDSYLVLRDDFHDEGGNYFLDQLLGANIRVMGREEYMEKGGFDFFLEEAAEQAKKDGKKPFVVPVGGSSALGCWGYIDCFNEIVQQLKALHETLPKTTGDTKPITDIVVTTGSGGTLAGLGLAAKYFNETKQLPAPIKVHAYGVCDSPDYFYKMTDTLTDELFANAPADKKPGPATEWMDIRTARGLGYSKASSEELEFLNKVARTTGILLDRAYTNKCVFQLVKDLASGSLKPEGNVLFIHTGGGPSVFDQWEKIIKCEGFESTPFSPTGVASSPK